MVQYGSFMYYSIFISNSFVTYIYYVLNQLEANQPCRINGDAILPYAAIFSSSFSRTETNPPNKRYSSMRHELINLPS